MCPRSLFAPCHALVPPQHYYEACMFDTCFVPNAGMECASLQTYAALCAQQGACIDWRNRTHGACRKCLPAPGPQGSPRECARCCAQLGARPRGGGGAGHTRRAGCVWG